MSSFVPGFCGYLGGIRCSCCSRVCHCPEGVRVVRLAGEQYQLRRVARRRAVEARLPAGVQSVNELWVLGVPSAAELWGDDFVTVSDKEELL